MPNPEELKLETDIPKWFNFVSFSDSLNTMAADIELEVQTEAESDTFARVTTFRGELLVESTLEYRFRKDDETIKCTTADSAFEHIRILFREILLANLDLESLPDNFDEFFEGMNIIRNKIAEDFNGDFIMNLLTEYTGAIAGEHFFLSRESEDFDYKVLITLRPEEVQIQ